MCAKNINSWYIKNPSILWVFILVSDKKSNDIFLIFIDNKQQKKAKMNP